MAKSEIVDVDRILVAIEKARKWAEERGKPIQLDRVAVFAGINHELVSEMIAYSGDDEGKLAIANSLKMVKQESRADIMDCLSEKGNVTGFIFQGKANHGMVETVAHDVNIAPIRFVGSDEIPD